MVVLIDSALRRICTGLKMPRALLAKAHARLGIRNLLQSGSTTALRAAGPGLRRGSTRPLANPDRYVLQPSPFGQASTAPEDVRPGCYQDDRGSHGYQTESWSARRRNCPSRRRNAGGNDSAVPARPDAAERRRRGRTVLGVCASGHARTDHGSDGVGVHRRAAALNQERAKEVPRGGIEPPTRGFSVSSSPSGICFLPRGTSIKARQDPSKPRSTAKQSYLSLA